MLRKKVESVEMFDFSNVDETIFQTNKTFRYTVFSGIHRVVESDDDTGSYIYEECHAGQNHNGPPLHLYLIKNAAKKKKKFFYLWPVLNKLLPPLSFRSKG